MLWLFWYISTAMLAVMIDAIACHISKKRFNLIGTVIVVLFWPVVIPIVVHQIMKHQEEEGW